MGIQTRIRKHTALRILAALRSEDIDEILEVDDLLCSHEFDLVQPFMSSLDGHVRARALDWLLLI